LDPNKQAVCIREIQKSLKFSAKKLIEDKIRALGVVDYFEITLTEIRRKGGTGIIIFQGMQDHTAESIKSLEGFDIAWVEEAQSLSAHSLELLLPTIRATGSEIWFSWNPDQSDDPVDVYFAALAGDESAVCIHANYPDNPFLPQELADEAERHRRMKPDTFGHVWLGEYNELSDRYVFSGRWRIADFETEGLGDPLHGMDFGFANDPTVAVMVYVANNRLYIRKDCGKVGLDLDDTAKFVKDRIDGIEKYVIRADCARPESISYLKRHGLPRIDGPAKLKIIDGIEFIKSFDEVIIHPECKATAEEFRKYSYKVDKRTGDILPDIVDAWNHYIDSIRYALYAMIKGSAGPSLLIY